MSSTILLILGSDEVAGGGGGADVEAVGAAVASERAKTDDEPSGLYIHCIFVESARAQSLKTDGDGESVSEGYSSHRTNAAHPLRGRDREQRAMARSEDEQRVYETTMILEEKMEGKYGAHSLPLLC